MTGVAVKVTLVPEQILLFEAAIETDGVTGVPTIMVTEFDVAVVGLAQVAVEVITQVTTLPLANEALV